MQLSQTQQAALTKAVQLLDAVRVKYHIKLPDGTELGTPIEPAVDTSKKQRAKRGPPQGPQNAAYVREAVAGMAVGDVRLILPQDGDTIERLGRNLSAFLCKEWGNGSHTYARTEDGVEVLRTT